MPAISSIIVTVIILLSVYLMKAFDLIYTITEGGPGRATTVTNYLVYQTAFEYFDPSYAMAIAIVFILIMVGAIFSVKKISGR